MGEAWEHMQNMHVYSYSALYIVLQFHDNTANNFLINPYYTCRDFPYCVNVCVQSYSVAVLQVCSS